jgi:hypothetical protein
MAFVADAKTEEKPKTGRFVPDAQPLDKDYEFGTGEALLSVGTGLAGGVAGTAVELGGVVQNLQMPGGAGNIKDPMGMGKKVEHAMTYQPRSQQGQDVLASINDPEIAANIVYDAVNRMGGGDFLATTLKVGTQAINPVTYLKGLQKVQDWILKHVPDEPQVQAGIDLLLKGAVTKLPAGMKEAGDMAGSGLRTLLRGGEESAAKMRSNIESSSGAGVDMTLGQLSAGGLTLESGAGQRVVAKQVEQLSAREIQLADNISAASTPEKAGLIIEKGLTGKGGFRESFRKLQDSLYAAADRLLPGDSLIDVSNTRAIFAELNKGETNISEILKNPKIQRMQGALEKDMAQPPAEATGLLDASGKPYMRQQAAPEGFNFGELKNLRSQVGEALGSFDMAPEIPRVQLKRVYEAISQDMEAAAASKGPEALEAMQRANRATRGFHDRVDSYLKVLAEKDIPNKVYQAAVGDVKNGPEIIRTVMKSLQTEGERDAVRSVFVRELGRNPAGEFSAMKFVDDWQAVRPEVKNILFGKEGGGIRGTLDDFAFAASKAKKTQATLWEMKNYGATHGGGVGAAAALSFLAGNWGMAPVLFGGFGAAFLTGRLVSNPAFLKWVAETSKMPPTRLPVAIANLERAQGHDPDVREYLDQLNWLGERKAPAKEQQQAPAAAPAPAPTPAPIQARAKGGPVAANKPYLVGEKGPEVIVPSKAGQVIPNQDGGMEKFTGTITRQIRDLRDAVGLIKERITAEQPKAEDKTTPKIESLEKALTMLTAQITAITESQKSTFEEIKKIGKKKFSLNVKRDANGFLKGLSESQPTKEN